MIRYRVHGDAQGTWLLSPMKNLSRIGANFLCDKPFSVGTLLELQVLLPMAKDPLRLLAKVVRARPGPIGCMEHSVTFEAADATTAAMLDHAVTFFLKRRS